MSLKDEITKGIARGWVFTPLNGKIPVLKGWTKKPKPSLSDVIGWVDAGHNIGLRTGSISGVVVIDADENANISKLNLPNCPTVTTGGNGKHFYFSYRDGIRNSSGQLGPHIDVRGDGGQVVFPGSVHPDTGIVYEWSTPPGETLPELPEHIVAMLAAEKPKEPKPTKKSRTLSYADAALSKELDAVRAATPGSRNSILNRATFNVAQLDIPDDVIISEMTAAARATGLPDAEISATIRSALSAGRANPRVNRIPPIPTNGNGNGTTHPGSTHPTHVAKPPKPDVLTLGSHVDSQGVYHEVGSDVFIDAVVNAFPPDAVYRRADIAGQIRGDKPGQRKFVALTTEMTRRVIDKYMRLKKWVAKKDEDPVSIFQNCNRDWASLVLGNAGIHSGIRELITLVSYPVYDSTWTLVPPGWHSTIFYDEPSTLRGLIPETESETIRAVLNDLVVDFPFANDASRDNFIGLLLTPILRPAIEGNVPFHCIIAPLERTGKSKLAEEVFGGIILGHPTPAMQITDSDEERDKRIIGTLLKGGTIIHLDNLPPHIDSPVLSSLLTARTYQGRILGASQIADLPNNLTLVGTGNNITASGELGKRIVPIQLQPKTSRPEDRSDFKHPRLTAHVRGKRRRVLECLIGMVEIWKRGTHHRSTLRMGGFEDWAESIGGILDNTGYTAWRTNEPEWRSGANPYGEDLSEFIKEWWNKYGSVNASASELCVLAREKGMLSTVFHRKSAPEYAAAMGRFLSRHVSTPVDGWIVRKKKAGIYALEETGNYGRDAEGDND